MMETTTAEWQEVATLEEFADTDRKLVDLGGLTQVGIFKEGEEFFAVSAWCSHQRMSIMNGPVDDGEIMCPLHGARFCLKTGENMSLPAVKPIASYPLRIDDGKILIKVT